MKRGDTYSLFATYPICYFSGQLGPKLRSFDRQSPEGVYLVSAKQLNPASRWHRAFNLGFPNAYDRAQGRTGSYLMVHGGCSSVGCYAMTNPVADDLFRLATAAFSAGQPAFQVQALPFRMTADALALRGAHANAPFWEDLRDISEAFEQSRRPPDVAVCDGRYRVANSPGAVGSCRKL
jgi:murein L,D-transpeptidase YafK